MFHKGRQASVRCDTDEQHEQSVTAAPHVVEAVWDSARRLGSVMRSVSGRGIRSRTGKIGLQLPTLPPTTSLPIKTLNVAAPFLCQLLRFHCLLFSLVAVVLRDLAPNQIKKAIRVSKSKWCGLEHPVTAPGRE